MIQRLLEREMWGIVKDLVAANDISSFINFS